VRFDLPVPEPEEMSRDELIVVVRRLAGQITAMAGQLSELMETNEALSGKLARLEHLLSRNSGNSSSPPSKDDDPGEPAPPEKSKRDKGGPTRARGKQPGAAGTHLPWTDNPDDRRDRFPQGRCECGEDLGGARDLGIVDRYQQHEIPQVAVKVTQ
jgi:transposase